MSAHLSLTTLRRKQQRELEARLCKELVDAVEAEAEKADAEYKAFMIIDLEDGGSVTLVWIGKTAKMKQIKCQLKALPPIALAYSARHLDSAKIFKALGGKKRTRR